MSLLRLYVNRLSYGLQARIIILRERFILEGRMLL